MTSSPSDPCQANLLGLEAALDRILAAVSPLEACEQMSVKAACGRVLADTLTAPMDLPSFANAAMDGYAVPACPAKLLTVAGEAWAGRPYPGELKADQCVRVFTGAPVPAGTAAVIMQEEVEQEGRSIRLHRLPDPGENIRPAGGDVRCGEAVLPRGRLLQAADLGLLAALGIAQVRVFQKPRVAYFSSGDELRGLGEPLATGQIYDSNRYSLHGLLSGMPVTATDLGSVPDDLSRLTGLLREAGCNFDVILSTGGASVGERDLLHQALAQVGEIRLWRIAIKPGKPLIFGSIGQAGYFGLPGNPVSVHVTFTQLVRPALWKLAGSPCRPLRLRVRCRNDLTKVPGRLEFQRGRLGVDDQGQLVVIGLAGQGSHQLASLSRANCFIILPAESHGVPAGSLVEVEPFSTRIPPT